MTDFALPAHVEELRARTREFIDTVVIPAEPKPGEVLSAETRTMLQQEARKAGVFAPHVPVEYGGHGLPIRYWSPIFQEAGRSLAGPQALNCAAPDEGNMHLLNVVASPEQKQRYLAPLAAGEVRSAFAMTEPHPGAGADPAALSTTAVRTSGGWIINGEKRFISGAEGAAFVICMARTDVDNEGSDGATMFIVDADNPGMRLERHIPTIDRSIIGGHMHVTFRDCFVPDDAVLGEVGKGFRYAQVRLGPARLTHCMRWLGLARRALDIALERATERRLFGSALADLGMAQAMIADSVIDIETSDALIAKNGWLLDTDERAGRHLASVTKVHVAEAVNRVIDRAMQLCGGDGVSDDFPLAAFFSEVRPFRIYDGPSEVHRWAIARRAARSVRRTAA